MQNITVKIAVMAVLTMLSVKYSASTSTPVGKVGTNSMTVAELEKAGDLARAQKDYDQAIRCFRAALRKDGKNSQLYNKLGMSELKNNDLDGARLDFGKAIKYDRKFADAVSDLGAVYYQKKSYGSRRSTSRRPLRSMKHAPRFTSTLGQPGMLKKNWRAPWPNTLGRWNWTHTLYSKTPEPALWPRSRVRRNELASPTCWQKFMPAMATWRTVCSA